MFETIKRLYIKIGNPEVVTKAVEKRWVNQSEADLILLNGISISAVGDSHDYL